MKRITVLEFLEKGQSMPILDVRSPAEYAQAHIPGAISLPLFSNEQRAVVGTAYKQHSREMAIKIGLDYFGPNMRAVVETVEKLVTNPENAILVHCWRGGMRSGAIAWLLNLYGFTVYTLEGGYKAYRNWVLQQFKKEYPFKVLGGYTGSAKTDLLHLMASNNVAIIDLEGLAKHKGSALGGINQPEAPSQEMFENQLAEQLYLNKSVPTIWLEDESQRIGNLLIPNELRLIMQKAPVYFMNIPFENRLQYLVQQYGQLPQDKLVAAILRIQKRLGGLDTKNAINYLIEGNISDSFAILLKYYDKYYLKALEQKEKIIKIECDGVDLVENFKKLQ